MPRSPVVGIFAPMLAIQIFDAYLGCFGAGKLLPCKLYRRLSRTEDWWTEVSLKKLSDESFLLNLVEVDADLQEIEDKVTLLDWVNNDQQLLTV